MKITADSHWTPEDSRNLYGIKRWGAGRFIINDQGQVCVQAELENTAVEVPLPEIIDGIRQRGYQLPVLIRFTDLLEASLKQLHQSFAQAIKDLNYRGRYRGVFPVKVNQQRQVIDEITRSGAPLGHGLEAGSKAELVLALARLPENGLLILNGYKDSEFIDLGLWATRLGHQCFFVIESPAELPRLIQQSRALGVRPLIGLRTKVSTQVGGLWTETSGDRSSFGLSTAQLLTALDQLRTAGMLDCLQLLHCHLGSQIPHIEDIRNGVLETCRFYAELIAEGAPLNFIDFGGGLAIDYSGSGSGPNSRDYSLKDYCQTLVSTIGKTLDPLGIDHPQIITESGRATVADSSVLLFNVLGSMHFDISSEQPTLNCGDAPLIHKLAGLFNNIEPTNIEKTYQQAIAYRDQARNQFRTGDLSLRQRAHAEKLFLMIARRVLARIPLEAPLPEALIGLRRNLADIYYGNFSVFQSLPDTWAVGQTFPLLPIERHNEPPCRDAMISDLTCDCDGKLDNFNLAGVERPTLPLHPLNENQDYLLGVFLMGAYQETLGDLHNLFGDTHTLNVKLLVGGGFELRQEIEGDSIGDLLSYIEYDPRQLEEQLRMRAEHAVRDGNLNINERKKFLDFYRQLLQGYSYFKASEHS